jgi:hypothetical protein
VIGGNFVNNSGSTAPITANQWLVYSTDPRLNTRNGLTANYKHYAQTYTDNVTPDYVTSGNWFLYSITPVLTVTPNLQAIAYGVNPADITYTITGFIDDDTYDTAGISGLGVFGVDNFTGKAGSYNISYLRGLASRLGYTFVDNTESVNELTVTPATSVPTIQVNLNMMASQLTPLQVSTTFLYWYRDRFADYDDSVDYDFGQYKGDVYNKQTVSYEAHRKHGKQHWHEKKRNHKSIYTNLLIGIENSGIKLPAGWWQPEPVAF